MNPHVFGKRRDPEDCTDAEWAEMQRAVYDKAGVDPASFRPVGPDVFNIGPNRSSEPPANGPDRSDYTPERISGTYTVGGISDHAAASADLLRLYAKRIAQGENPADWPEFALVMRVIARRL